MLSIDDILTELDVLAVDSTAVTGFAASSAEGSANLSAKRRIVVDEWLRFALEQNNYQPERHLLRGAPELVYGFTGGAYTDLTDKVGASTLDAVDLASVIVTPASDALFVRAQQPFRALWLSLFDHVNVGTTCVCTPQYWNGGAWAGFSSVVDATAINSGVSLSGGGRIGWSLPTNWSRRPLGSHPDWGFWLKLAWTAAPTASTDVTQVLPVRRSRLTPACVYRVLAMLYAESWGAQRGEWKDKATQYSDMADNAITDVIANIQDEFVVAGTDEAVTPAMMSSVATDPPLTTWERG